jgi:hypothetical protein
MFSSYGVTRTTHSEMAVGCMIGCELPLVLLDVTAMACAVLVETSAADDKMSPTEKPTPKPVSCTG